MSAKKIFIILILIFSLLPLVDLTNPGLPVTHDGQDHVARISNFYRSITEGILVPRWASDLNWGYGHPILMFLYPLPSYLASFYHFIGFSLVDSTKLVFAFTYVISNLLMFLWVSEAWNSNVGIIATLIYGFSPYRFVDLYVRGAIGEHVAFVFPPLIMWSLLRLARKDRDFWTRLVLSLSVAGLIISHNAISIMFLPVILLYVIYLYFFETTKSLKFIVDSSLFTFFGFVLAAFFWVPAFFEGKYTLRDIVTRGEFSNRFVTWTQFFWSPWNYGGGNEFTKELGQVGWLSIFGGIWLLLNSKEKKIRWFLGVGLGIVLISLFMMSGESVFIWNNFPLIQKFQFPWRLLSLVTFVTSVVGAVVATKIPKKIILWLIIGSGLVALLNTRGMWHAKSYSKNTESFYENLYEGTTDTGESSPIWSVRFMEERPKAPMEVVEGKANITQVSRTTTKHEYLVNAFSQARLVENTLYFPGWRVTVDAIPATIEFQDQNYRGLMTFWLDKGEHKVVISFSETKLRKMADTISFIGLLFLVGYFFRFLWLQKK